jgi:tRNA A-37 threonylcarbamoyl transferase component Bud32
MEPLVGKEIDNYKILSVLGKGGMGIVYKARDKSLDRDVAIKMMDTSLTRDESFLKRFQSEAKALAKLQNPNIVSVFALRESEYGFCIVMEFVEGGTLSDRLREEGRLSVPEAIIIFKQLLSALDHAHKVGIIHRDLKPGNVMLSQENVVKVTDFGLAKIQAASAATVTVGTGGTLFYMSPEQVKGLANVDARGDIYSIGMTLYEALAGRMPFGSEDTDFSIRQAIVQGNIPSPDKLNPSLPREIVKIIQKSIERDPKDRYQTAGEMRQALEEFEQRSRASAVHDNGGAQGVRGGPGGTRSARYRPLIITAVALLAIIAGIVIFRGMESETSYSLSVNTIPGDAAVYVNGESIGRAPVAQYKLKSSTVSVSVRKEGFITRDTSLVVPENQDLAVTMQLVRVPEASTTPVEQPPPAGGTVTTPSHEQPGIVEAAKGTLVLQAKPAGEVYVDGVAKGSAARGLTLEVVAGNREVEFKSARSSPVRRRVSLRAGQHITLACYFERSISVNSVDGTGKHVWGTIMVDGAPTGYTTPKEFALSAGKHTISVSREGFETVDPPSAVTIDPVILEGGQTPPVEPMKFVLRKK